MNVTMINTYSLNVRESKYAQEMLNLKKTWVLIQTVHVVVPFVVVTVFQA